ncbi:MAG TPA: hypothetical protein VHL78_09580 [Actinomycetota bacterium]|nr:hypothetical protein [Actinomycetota bacterium]
MLTVVGALVAVMLMATAALAHITFFDIDNTAFRTSPTTVNVRGTIQCTAGETYTIRVTLTQDGNTGQGTQRGFCSGDLQTWQVEVQLVRGTGFQEGPATACAAAQTRERGTDHRDALRHCETVQIQEVQGGG